MRAAGSRPGNVAPGYMLRLTVMSLAVGSRPRSRPRAAHVMADARVAGHVAITGGGGRDRFGSQGGGRRDRGRDLEEGGLRGAAAAAKGGAGGAPRSRRSR